METIIKLFNLQTKMYNNILSDISEEDADISLCGQLSSLKWIAIHILSTRASFADYIGLKFHNPFHDLVIDENIVGYPKTVAYNPKITYPPLKESLKYWNDLEGIFCHALSKLSEDEYSIEIQLGVEMLDGCAFKDFLLFIAYHEAYHIGQLGLIRAKLGYPGDNYRGKLFDKNLQNSKQNQ